MALKNYTIKHGEWKKICNAGQSGAAWLQSTGDGTAKVLIAHTPEAQTPTDDIPVGSAVDLLTNRGYILPQTGNPADSVDLSADTASDVYYATLIDSGLDAVITTDFI